MISLLALVFLLLALCFLFWWLIVSRPKASTWVGVWSSLLYDLYASRYDRVKQFDEQADLMLISQPILARIRPQADPLILDVATGAGRLPLIMARNGCFQRSRHRSWTPAARMLDVARRKVAAERFEGYITLTRHDAGDRLPFDDDDVFDVATCLEALEFLPDPQAALQEMCRVLRPGGLLLTSIRIDTRWMPNRTWSEQKRCGASWRRWTCATFALRFGRKTIARSGRVKRGRAFPSGAGARELGPALGSSSRYYLKLAKFARIRSRLTRLAQRTF